MRSLPVKFLICISTFSPTYLSSRKLTGKLEGQRLTDIVVEAVDIEKEFICEALPVDLIGMNKGLMSQYIDFCADRLLVALGAQKHYNTPNPFDWMELLSLQCVPAMPSAEPCQVLLAAHTHMLLLFLMAG